MNHDALTMTMPGLRLPQRRLAGPTEPTTPFTQPRLRRAAVEDIPTTPDMRDARTTGRARAVRPLSQLEVGVGWNVGIKRKNNANEDSFVTLQGSCCLDGEQLPFGLFAVADGMGGHSFGREASQIAARSMMQLVLPQIMASNELSDDLCIQFLLSGVEQANANICRYSEQKQRDMGTTLTAALLLKNKAYIINVGDSRTYLLREREELTKITQDHSLVARLVAAGSITPDEVYTHPERNKVYRCVGNSNGVEVDWFTVDIQPGDQFLLCSDGLWEMVRDPEIERILRYGMDVHRVSEQLVEAALRGGGADNITAVVVHIQ